MKAAILCAGLGTRLMPLTGHWPKPAIPVLGQPLLRYTLALLKTAQVDGIGINVHHLADRMEAVAVAECARETLPLHIARERVIQGTAGGVRGLRQILGGDHFLVMNGDVLFSFDLQRALDSHRSLGAAATMILMPMPARDAYASVEVDGGGQVRRIAGRGPGGSALTPWHFTGVHLMAPAVLDFISSEGPEDLNRDVYPRMMERGLIVRGEVVEGHWYDLGTAERYLASQIELLGLGEVPKWLEHASPFSEAHGSGRAGWSRQGTPIEGATVIPPVYLDTGSAVAAGASVGPFTYLGPGARVEAGARVRRTVVLEGTRIGAGEDLVDMIAWRGHRLRGASAR